MQFPVTQKLDLEPNHGAAINIRIKDNRLFYWQEHGVGYIPVNERIMQNNVVAGAPVQLGISANWAGDRHRMPILPFYILLASSYFEKYNKNSIKLV